MRPTIGVASMASAWSAIGRSRAPTVLATIASFWRCWRLWQRRTVPPQAILPGGSTPIEEARPSDAERVLALTRYTSGLLRLAPTDVPIETRVSSQRQMSRSLNHFGPFENWTAMRFLTEGPPRALLTGLTGVGKSFALLHATAHLAQIVHQACLDDTVNTSNLALPVLIDLKLYQGDLRARIDAALPAAFNLKDFLGKLRLRLFLDAFNEMPSSYLEDGSLFKSLEALRNELGDFDYVITSRIADGVPL